MRSLHWIAVLDHFADSLREMDSCPKFFTVHRYCSSLQRATEPRSFLVNIWGGGPFISVRSQDIQSTHAKYLNAATSPLGDAFAFYAVAMTAGFARVFQYSSCYRSKVPVTRMVHLPALEPQPQVAIAATGNSLTNVLFKIHATYLQQTQFSFTNNLTN